MERLNKVILQTQNELNSSYLKEMNAKNGGRTSEEIDELRKNINFDKIVTETQFNTNIADYSIDDIFGLLDIELSSMENYEELKKAINEKVDHYVGMFKNLKNEAMTSFFEEVRVSILGNLANTEGNNLTEAEKLLLVFDDKFNAEKNRGLMTKNTDTTNEGLYDNSKGAGNPINRKTISKLLTVDSRFRHFYNESTSTNYNVDLPYVINNVIELKLSDLEFPTTYYPFTDEYENNYFWIRYCYSLSDEVKIERYIYIYVEAGNYYHAGLIDQIQAVFTATGAPLVASFNLDYNNAGGVGVGNGKVTIGVDEDSSYNLYDITEFELNFTGSKLTSDIENYNVSHEVYDTDIINRFYNVASTVPYQQRFGWMLGFRNKTYNTSTYYTSEAILDILGPKYLYLVVDDLNSSSNINFFSNSEDSLLNGNILARISLKGYPFSIQSQGDFGIYTEPRYYYGPVNIHKLGVKMIDEYGRIININGMDFSFTLSLTTIYSQTS